LVTNRFEADNAFFEFGVIQTGHAGLDGIVESLEPQIGFRRPLVQFADMFAAALGSLLPAIEHGCHYLFETLRLKQAVFDMAGNEVVEPLHRDRAALAASLALPGLGGASVVTVGS
jgi:hypothetical protein